MLKKSFFILGIIGALILSSQESVQATHVILGKIKSLGQGPDGNMYYRCKNRAMVCLTSDETSNNTHMVHLHLESGVVVEEVQAIQVFPMYIDGEGNEIVEIALTPLEE